MRTTLAVAVALALASSSEAGDADEIASWLAAYDKAFVAKDLSRLATFYHPDVTVFEGGSVNRGWVDYRDHHLGPELAEFEGLEFAHHDATSQILGSGRRVTYVTARYRIKGRIKDRQIDSGGLETLILVKGNGGTWRIRHCHVSSGGRPVTPTPEPK